MHRADALLYKLVWNKTKDKKNYKKYSMENYMERMEQLYDEMVKLFEMSNSHFIHRNKELFRSNVAERTLCGSLKESIDCIKAESKYKNYFADVEYNRKQNGKVKNIINNELEVIKINCDLILHSRGQNVKLDNLIAIEMKKSKRPLQEKIDDKNRLIALTKDTYDDVWCYDGKTLPEHVCRYILGVYYEIDIKKKIIYLEYYRRGIVVDSKIINIE